MKDETNAAGGDGPRTERVEGTVLVVDDNSDIVELHTRLLSDRFEVRKALNGRECLEKIDEDVDVVLLDRRMPDLEGREVLAEIREREYDCKVAMVTAVRPHLDIIDMEFDAYLVKPIDRDELNEVVDNLLMRAEYSERIQELMAAAWKLGALRAEYGREELEDHEEFAELKERERELREENAEHFSELIDRVDTQMIYKDILEKA